MPESKVPLRTGPETASEGIQDTVVTDDSMRMLHLSEKRPSATGQPLRVREYATTFGRARG